MSTIQTFQPTRILSRSNALDIQHWARACMAEGHRYLLIDLRHVSFMDSNGLGLLIATHHMVHEANGVLALSNLKGQALMLVEMIGLETVFSIYNSYQDFEAAIVNVPCLSRAGVEAPS